MSAVLRRLPMTIAEALALVLLTVAALAAFLALPTYPNYDSLYSLLWARELLDGVLPSFDAYRAPTQHPLWVAICIPLAALGDGADRVLLGLCVLSFVALLAGIYVLGKRAFGTAVGVVAALLLASRLDVPFLAARGYVDVTYMALVVWAAALEVARPRRGGGVWVLLTLAGLLRPEAWVLAALYALRIAWRRLPATWLRAGLIVAVAPLLWALSDVAVTGDPLYSLNYTTELAELLGRRQSLAELPGRTLDYLSALVKPPVLLLAVAGIVLSRRLDRERAFVPLTLVGWGVGTFLLVSLRGFSVIDRYLAVAAVALTLFAAYGAAGFVRLPRGHRARRPWALGALAVIAGGAVYTALHLNPGYIQRELSLRTSVRADLAGVLDAPAVRAARACGPISVPNHKLVPDTRWLAHAGAGGVIARSDRTPRHGVAIVVTGGTRFLKHPAYGPYDQDRDSPRIQVPPDGFSRAVVGDRFTAYVRCAVRPRRPCPRTLLPAGARVGGCVRGRVRGSVGRRASPRSTASPLPDPAARAPLQLGDLERDRVDHGVEVADRADVALAHDLHRHAGLRQTLLEAVERLVDRADVHTWRRDYPLRGRLTPRAPPRRGSSAHG